MYQCKQLPMRYIHSQIDEQYVARIKLKCTRHYDNEAVDGCTRGMWAGMSNYM